MTTPILNITEISGNQLNQYITANEAFRALEASTNDFLVVDLSAGDIVLTEAEFTAAYTFIAGGHSVARALTVPASKRAFTVRNTGTANLSVTRGITTAVIAANEAALLITDGTTDGLFNVAGGGGGGGAVWGGITGTLSDQTDLQAALDQKADSSSLGTMAAQNANAVAITGGTVSGLSSLGVAGDITISAAGAKIRGDFSNSTIANRVAFQTSTINGNTVLDVIPNGSATSAVINVANSSNQIDRARLAFICDASRGLLSTFADGAGILLPLHLGAGGSAAQISTSGNFGVGLTPDTSARIQSSNGIKLGNTANSNTNVLDWYEKGTFTPIVVGSTTAGVGTYTVQNGRYIRVGSVVFITLYVGWSAHTGVGTMNIVGIPFTNGGTPSVYSNASAGIIAGAGKWLTPYTAVGGTGINYFGVDAAGGNLTFPSIPNIGEARVSGFLLLS